MADVGMWKPVLTALALPPVPMLVLVLWGAKRLIKGKVGGLGLIGLSVLLLWFSACDGTAIALQNHVLKVPAPLTLAQRQAPAQGGVPGQPGKASRSSGRAGSPQLAVIVLGAGLEVLAPEYGVSNLSGQSMERLRYGLWLSRQLGAQLGFSGGVGWAQKGPADGPTEAEVAARIAAQEFGVALRWIEATSSDTRGNANETIALLGDQGVREVVLVTGAFHMPRARKVFEEAAVHWSSNHPDAPAMHITPAATGYWRQDQRALLAWMPSAPGMAHVHAALRECLGLLSGV
jgi:uncharacterized SAM-binding protein YcdF (DUF218 family)